MNSEKDLPVSDKKEIVIKDACILFDLVDLDLLSDFFRLAVTAMTTPQVIDEITNETQWKKVSEYIEKSLLQIDNSGEFNAILEISIEYPGLSMADSSVLELALRKDAVIFSSDGSLRKISTKKGITVRGVLWVIEQLYQKKIINKQVALEKLKGYFEINVRAPKTEIEKLVNRIQADQ